MRILSLDTDGSYQRDLAAELEASGHQVDLLSSCSEALACDAARPFDLAIVEARLPDGDALRFLRDLGRSRGGALPPVLVLTGSDEPGLRERCLEAGAVRFLRKDDGWPATTAEIYGVMAEVEPLPELPAAQPRADGRVFRGNLETIEIVDIVQLLNLGRKTGTLVLSAPPREGRMHFHEGEVVAAASGALEGPPAFAELLLLDRGTFRFEAGEPSVERNVHQPTSTLLLDALRMHDEEGRSSHQGLTVPDGEADPFAADFELEHRGADLAPPEADLPAEADSWLYTGMVAGVAAQDPDANPAHVPAERDEALPPWAPPVRGTPPTSFDVPAAPTFTPAPDAPPADVDISRTRLATSRRPRRALSISPGGRRTAVLAGIAAVVLLGTGSVVLVSDVMRGDAAAEEEADIRELLREAADNQARIDSLQQLLEKLTPGVQGATAPAADPEAAQRISLLQNEIARVAAARDAVREAAAQRQADEERRRGERRESEPDPPETVARDQRPEERPAPPAPAQAAAAESERPADRQDVAFERASGDSALGGGGEPARIDPVGVLPISTAARVPEAAPAPAPAPAPPAAPVPDYGLDAIRGGPQFVPVDSRATPRSAIRPAYPRALADRKIGGTVTYWVLVDAAGNVVDVRVLRSSGWAELDRAGLEALRRAAFNPARRGGAAVPAWTQQQILFKLD